MPFLWRIQLLLGTRVCGFYVQSSFGHLAKSLATMVTTSTAGRALCQHVIPLVSLYNDQADNTQVSLTHLVNVGDGNNEKRKYNVPFCPPKMWRLFVIVYWNLTMSQPSHICHSPWDLSSFPFFDSV